MENIDCSLFSLSIFIGENVLDHLLIGVVWIQYQEIYYFFFICSVFGWLFLEFFSLWISLVSRFFSWRGISRGVADLGHFWSVEMFKVCSASRNWLKNFDLSNLINNNSHFFKEILKKHKNHLITPLNIIPESNNECIPITNGSTFWPSLLYHGGLPAV